MNALAIADTNTKTMSSLEIADLTGKEHRHVLRDIRDMLDSLGLVEPNFGRYYTAANGKQNPCFHLPKDLCFTLVAGYSAPLRHKIVTRWIELERKEFEGQVMLPNFNDPVAAARAWADAQEARIQAEQRLAIAAPKASVVDNTFKGKAVSLRDHARKYDGINLIALPATLRSLGYFWKDGENRYRVLRRKSEGLFFEKWNDAPSGRTFGSICVTEKGVVLLDDLYRAGKLPLKKAYRAA